MQRVRRIAGTPVRSAAAAWTIVTTLVAETLERSNDISDGSVAKALAPLDGLAAAIAASGSVDAAPFTVIGGDLYLEIYVVRGDEAFTIEENLEPVPGGASAPSDWLLHIQPPAHLVDTVVDAISGSEHLKVGKPTTIEAKSQASPTTSTVLTIDESALRRIGGSQ